MYLCSDEKQRHTRRERPQNDLVARLRYWNNLLCIPIHNNMKKILVVIDCQNDFITGSLRNTKAIKAVPNIVNKIRAFQGDAIIYTMDTHGEDYMDTKEGKALPVVHCVKGTDGWKLQSEVESELLSARFRGIRIFEIQKPTFGAINLPEDIKTVVGDEEFEIEFVGFCTDICVISNILITKAAFYEKATVSIDTTCCAGVTPEKHEAALEAMRSCQIVVK